jgi:hypothetical protein
MKRLVRTFLSWLILAPAIAQAQFTGFVGLQTTQQTLATGTACTGTNQVFPVRNLGQAYHFAAITSVGATRLTMQIQGVDNHGNVFGISDVVAAPGFGATRAASIFGVGYYPITQISISCLPSGGSATFSLSYSGAYAAYSSNTGDYLKAQLDKYLLNNVPGNADANLSIATPFGSSAGNIIFQYNGASAGGGTLLVQCDLGNGIGTTIFSTPLANVSTAQVFQIPPTPCITASVFYQNSGAAGTVITTYLFSEPGSFGVANLYTHVTGTTATAVKGFAGVLHTVTINTGGAGTLSIFDLASANCTGTPATNTVAVITAVATTTQTFTYDVNMANGICVKASAAMDFTVSSQ